MSVYINGRFDNVTDGVREIWSDTKRFEYDPQVDHTYIKTLKKMDNFVEAEEVITLTTTSVHYHENYTTCPDVKAIINATIFRNQK